MQIGPIRKTGCSVAAMLTLISMSRALSAKSGHGSAPSAVSSTINPPHDVRPPVKIPFPQIKNWRTLRIILSRGVCFGTCLSYKVEIHGDGTVRYHGYRFVSVARKHTWQISQNAVRDCTWQFRTLTSSG